MNITTTVKKFDSKGNLIFQGTIVKELEMNAEYINFVIQKRLRGGDEK